MNIIRHFIWMAITVLFLAGPPAAAVTIDLLHELDGNSTGTTVFGTVDIAQNPNGADLDFIITANTVALGGGDIHMFYFNLLSPPDPVSGLSVTSGNWTGNPFTVIGPNPSVTGGGGAAFDWGINFGNGGGPSGNGVLTVADFTLSADEALAVGDLWELSHPNNTPAIYVAVHFQDTAIFNATSETVGGTTPTPLPVPALLLGTGLVGLVLFRRHSGK